MATVSDTQGKYRWFIDGQRIGVIEENRGDGDEKFVSPTTSGENLRVFYTAKAVPFNTDLTASSEIPSQFHEALAFKVIAELYRLPGEKTNLQLAAYYDQLYELQIREAKKYAKRNHQRGGVIRPYNY
tara:strand:- start:12 stop:395 length:384 start_codon:yes stop_codon:yes gene_type:complete